MQPACAVIASFLGVLFEPGDVFEIRAPRCLERRGSTYMSTVSGYFTFEAIDRAADAIAKLDALGLAPGIYVTLNPVRPDLLARAANRLKRRATETSGDGDILRRRWLLVDIDPVRPPGVSATDAELERSATRNADVRAHLDGLGWPEPLVAMSGNGHHLLYRIDQPPDDDGLVRRVLAALAHRFDDEQVRIDRSVHNPARIVKVVGTVARKGDDLRAVAGVEDRPHRRSQVIEVPSEPGVVTVSALEALGGPAAPPPPAASRSSSSASFPSTPGELRTWLEARGVAVKGERRNRDHTLLLLERCPVNPDIVSTGESDIAIRVGDDGKLAYCNKHNRGQAYTWHDVRRAVDPKYRKRPVKARAAKRKTLKDKPPPGTICPTTGRVVLCSTRTLPTAKTYLRQFHAHPQGRTLHHYAGQFFAWSDSRFVEAEDAALRAKLLPWLHDAVRYVNRGGGWVPDAFSANPTTVNAALDSIRSVAHLPARTTPPAWLGEGKDRPDPREILPCLTQLLHLPTMKRLEASPALFAINALDYDPDPNADEPQTWLSFLGQVIGEDIESWDLLQDWFGYCLTGDTSQQKILLLVGPRRSGKGTIARVLRRVVGAGNVCGPTATSLAGSFGLQPLLGKSLAIVSDARFSGKELNTVVERLLCISGEDTLTVDRKHQTSVTMKLPTRFIFLANELPRFNDVSGALAGRFMVLRFTESFYGREDRQLTQKLLTELPGILNWAIEGWKRLNDRGHFVQPASVEDAIRDLEELASPAGAFVREKVDIKVGKRTEARDIWVAWKAWCEAEGRAAGTKQRLGRDLAAVIPGFRIRQGTYGRFYEGIALKECAP